MSASRSAEPRAADRAGPAAGPKLGIVSPEFAAAPREGRPKATAAASPLAARGQTDADAAQPIGGAGVLPLAGEGPVPLELVDTAADRLRPVDPAWARLIATTFETVGQLQKVGLVLEPSGRFTCDGHGFGATRIEAARLRGLTTIEARWVKRADVDPAGYRLPEILENLIRHDLDALERAEHLSELRAVHERLHPPLGRGGDRRSKQARADQTENISYWSLATEGTGLSRRAIEISLSIWGGLEQVLRQQLKGTSLAGNQAALRALSIVELKLQGKVAELVLSGAAATVADALLLARGKRLDTPAEKRFLAVQGGLSRLAAPDRAQIFEFYRDEIIERFRAQGLV